MPFHTLGEISNVSMKDLSEVPKRYYLLLILFIFGNDYFSNELFLRLQSRQMSGWKAWHTLRHLSEFFNVSSQRHTHG